MSAEFSPGQFDNDNIAAVIENIKQDIQSAGSVSDYVVSTQEMYAESLDGTVELSRMIRAAQFITNNKAGDLSPRVQAFYNGELLAMAVVNNLLPDSDPSLKSGFAHNFLKLQLEIDRLTSTKHAETIFSHETRLSKLSKSIQDELGTPSKTQPLHPLFESFGLNTTAELSFETSEQELAMMGFRMILTEALNPLSTPLPPLLHQRTEKSIPDKLDDDLLQRLKQADTNAYTKIPGSITIADLIKQYVPSDQDMQEVLNDPAELDWEDITYVRRNLLNKYYDDESQGTLNEFNDTYELISYDDLLSVTGELYAISYDEEGEASYQLLDGYTEIQGTFEGLFVQDAPTKKQLNRALNDNIDYDEAPRKPLVPVPVMRLRNPVSITIDIDGNKTIDLSSNQVFDIPLQYSNVIYKRLKPETDPQET